MPLSLRISLYRIQRADNLICHIKIDKLISKMISLSRIQMGINLSVTWK